MKKLFFAAFVLSTLIACSGKANVANSATTTADKPLIVASDTSSPEPTKTETPVPPTATPTPTDTPTPTPTPIEPIAFVIQDGTVIFSGPGDVYAEVGVLLAGDKVDLLAISEDGDWAVIQTAGIEQGWVLLEEIETAYDLAQLEFHWTPPTPVYYYSVTLKNVIDKDAKDFSWPDWAKLRNVSLYITCSIPDAGIQNIKLDPKVGAATFQLPAGRYKIKCDVDMYGGVMTIVNLNLKAHTTVTFTDKGYSVYP